MNYTNPQTPNDNQNQGGNYYSQQNPYANNNFPNQPQNQYAYNPQPANNNSEKKGLAIASLVLGIVSLTICCCFGWLPGIIGAILGIVALVKQHGGRGMAIAGLITSILGFLIGIYFLIGMITGSGEFAEEFKKAFEEQYYEETGETFDWDSYQ